MLLKLANNRRILFVGGKGGTGKTSISSALALAHAQQGNKVLLASTDPAHSLGQLWEYDLADKPSRVIDLGEGAVDAVEVDPAVMIERHFATVEKMMYRMLPEGQHAAVKQHLATAKTAPGSQESATLERVAQLIEDGVQAYDLIIFDTAPTGHTLHMLALPEQLTTWAESLLANRDRSERFAAAARGLVTAKNEAPSADTELRRRLLARRDRFSFMRATVTDTGKTSFILVGLAEKLPVAESLNLLSELGTLDIHVSALIINRRSPADAGAFMAARRKREEAHLAHLRKRTGDLPLLQVPLLARELTGTKALGELAEVLSEL